MIDNRNSINSKYNKFGINDRSQHVLRRLIDIYLESGEPVGSRTLAKFSGLGVSAATVRNIMSDLENMGLLYSPYTSSGRLPTSSGLKLFVDALLEVKKVNNDDKNQFQQLFDDRSDLRYLLNSACQKLSGITRLAGLVVAPKIDSNIRHIEFVRIAPDQALAILVTEDGLVENRLINIPKDVSSSVLTEASNFIKVHFSGKSIEQIRNTVSAQVEQHRNELSKLTEKLINIGVGTSSGESENSEIFIVHGHSEMLEDAEIKTDLIRMREIFKLLEERKNTRKLLEQTESGKGVQVFIGAENSLFSLSGCSAIVAPITSNTSNPEHKILGAIGVVGPSHMNYGRIVPIVDFTAHIISQHLNNLNVK